MNEWNKRQEQEANEVAYDLAHLEQGSLKILADKLACEHNTIQQNIMRDLVIPFIDAMASKDYCDLRNEGSVAFAKQVKEKLLIILPPLPYV